MSSHGLQFALERCFCFIYRSALRRPRYGPLTDEWLAHSERSYLSGTAVRQKDGISWLWIYSA